MTKLNTEVLTWLVENLTKKIDENTKETAAIHEKINDQKRLIEKIDEDVAKLSQSDSWLKQWVEEKIEDLKKKLDDEIRLRDQIGASKFFSNLSKNKVAIKFIAVFLAGIVSTYLIKDQQTLSLILQKLFSLIH